VTSFSDSGAPEPSTSRAFLMTVFLSFVLLLPLLPLTGFSVVLWGIVVCAVRLIRMQGGGIPPDESGTLSKNLSVCRHAGIRIQTWWDTNTLKGDSPATDCRDTDTHRQERN